MSIAFEHDDLNRLIAVHRAHLLELRLQQATLGSATPPHVAIEIARVEREIERLIDQAPAITNNELYRVMTIDSLRQDSNQWRLERQMLDMQATLNKLLEILAERYTIDARRRTPKQRTVNGGD